MIPLLVSSWIHLPVAFLLAGSLLFSAAEVDASPQGATTPVDGNAQSRGEVPTSPAGSLPDSLPTFVVEPFHVRAYRPLMIAFTRVNPGAMPFRPVSDGGDLLGFLPGVTGSRMGGHGIEPVIRGQSQTRLNIVNDGAYSHGGCPNRMDPPSALADVQNADQVVVLRGAQTVLLGGGGSGGTVQIQHLPPRFPEGKWTTAAFSSGVESNTGGLLATGQLAARDGSFYVQATGRHHQAGNYEDGAGREVRSGFEQSGGTLRVGWSRDASHSADADLVEAALEYDLTSDALFAGAGMDSPFSELMGVRVKGEHALSRGALRRIRISGYLSNVDHEMDNYTLRPATANFRVAKTTSNTHGGRILADLAGAAGTLTVGGDVLRLAQDGTRFGNNSDRDRVTISQAILWPDLALTDLGIFVEGKRRLSEKSRLVMGLRYDRIWFRYGAADHRPVLPTMGLTRSPNDLYQAFYGVTGEDVREGNLGGLVRGEYLLQAGLEVSAGISRTVRTADPTERALASEMGPMSWVGNPGLRPEKHHQAQLGVVMNQSAWSLGASLYGNRIDDYILRDSARGQEGIALNLPHADVYRNIDATLAGLELEGALRPLRTWTLDFDATFTWGRNDENRKPLPQIPAIQGNLVATRAGAGWSVGGRVHLTGRQTRVDTDPSLGTGLDLGKTPGAAILDFFGSADISSRVTVHAGVANLLNRTWANHLNRENGLDNTVIQVHEPGRSIYARISTEL